MKKVLFFATSFLILSFAKSQSDSLFQKNLDEITISASRQQIYTPGSRKDKTDSIITSFYKNLQLSQILNFSGNITVRSYGPGNLATSTLRGGNSYQTLVSWEGFAVNNTANGICDFNLIPSFLFDDITVNPGIPSSIQGSGSIGGGINITNSTTKKNEIEVMQTFGSFSTITGGIKNHVSSKYFGNNLKIFYSKSKNNYDFKNITEAGNPTQSLTNARMNLFSLIDEINFGNKKMGNFKISYWSTIAERQIPPTMLMPHSKAFQNDKTNKIALKWTKTFDKLNVKFSSLYQKDYLKYNDIDQNINSITHNNIITNDIEFRYKISKILYSGLGFTSSLTKANVENITTSDTSVYNNSSRNQFSIWASQFYKIQKLRTEFSLILRQDFTDKKFLPLIPSLGYKSILRRNISIFGQAGKVYRIPTLNDLYWKPGGNRNLKAESGFQCEQSIEFKNKSKNIEMDFSATLFSRVLNNWIQWQPVSLQIWSPFNIGKVYSRGFEFRNNFKIKITQKSFCKSGFSLNLTKSENIFKNDKNYGNQLIYVPFYNSSVFAVFVFSKTALFFQAISIGKRYTSSDNTEEIEGFTTLNTMAKQTFEFKKANFDIFFRINNFLNKSYEEVAWRPMPGRNYETGISINLKYKK